MRTILVVDDDDMIRELLVRIIQRRGVAVVSAASGKAAIEKYKTVNPDCVLLDIMLPDINGFQVLKEILSFDSSASVYFISGSTELQNKELASGAKGFFSKPVDMEKLYKVVDSVPGKKDILG